jgi:hypothetical protein
VVIDPYLTSSSVPPSAPNADAGLIPLLVSMLSAVLPLGQSIGVFAVIAYGLPTAAALLLPETKGRLLTAEAA